MNTKTNDQVFLSYANEDIDIIKRINNGLKKRNLNVWFDKECLRPGKWRPQILKAITRSRFFIICLSNAALKKTGDETPGFQDVELQTAFEIGMAQPENSFTIVPVRIENCDRGDHRIEIHQTFDLFSDFESELDTLSIFLGSVSFTKQEKQDVQSEEEILIKSLYGKAVALSFSGDHEGARKFYDSLLTLTPENSNALLNRGAALSHLGQLEEAIQNFTNAIKINPKETMAYHNRGMMLGQLGRAEEALKDFDITIEQCSTFPHVWSNRAITLMHLNRNEDALVSVDKALEIGPDLGEAWCNKGRILYNLNRKDEAYDAFDKSSNLLPTLLQNWSLKGFIKYEQGNFIDAIKNFNKALEISPHDLMLIQLKSKSLKMLK